jgi:hypothetical protein
VWKANELVVEAVELGLASKKIVYATISDMSTWNAFPSGNNQVRITLSGAVDEFKVFKKSRRYKDMVAKGVKIVYRGAPPPATVDGEHADDKKNASFDSILAELVRDQRASVQQLLETLAS